MSKTALRTLLGGVWILAMAAGIYGLVLRFTLGHEAANYGSYVPWGLWIAQYLYFVGLTAGLSLITSLIYVFRVRRLEPVARMALFTAAVTLVCGLLLIWLDLGQPLRFWKVYVQPQPSSMMAWMVWMYTLFSVLVVAQLWFALRADLVRWQPMAGLRGRVASILTFGRNDISESAIDGDRRMLRNLSMLGIPLTVAFSGGVGALFGVIGARPYWNSPMFPILFITAAVASASALLAFLVAFFWHERRSSDYGNLVSTLGRIALTGMIVYALIEWAEFSISLYSSIPAVADAYRLVLTGPFWWVFWIFHLGLGLVLPMALLVLRPRSPAVVGMAGLLIAALFIAVRANVVVPGQVVPELQGLERAFVDSRLSFAYVPSLAELLVSVFAVAFGIGLFLLGYRLLPLDGGEPSDLQKAVEAPARGTPLAARSATR